MLKKIFLLSLLLLLVAIPITTIEARTRANVAWPASPLGLEITESIGEHHYFKEYVYIWGERDLDVYGEPIPFDVSYIIQYFYEWLIVLGGLAVFIAFIWAGLLYMTSIGDASKMTEARKKINRALIGFALLLGSYLIFYTINPIFTRLGAIEIREIRTIDEKAQGKIQYFVKIYSRCNAHYKGKAAGIHIPLPIIGGTIYLFDLLGIDDLEFAYNSLTRNNMTKCSELAGAIKNNTAFQDYVCFKRDEHEGCLKRADNYQDLIELLKFYGPYPYTDFTETWWYSSDI